MMFRYLSKAKAMLALLAAIALGMLVSCNQPEEAPETVMGFTCLEDLEGHTVAVIKGSTSDVLLGDTNNFSNITLIQCNTPTDLFKAIESGNAECAITDTVVLMTMKLKEHKMAVDFNLPGGFDVAAAFNNKSEELCKQFNDFLVQIKSDGTLDSMFARWCSEQVDTIEMPQMPELANLKGHPIEVATLADNAPFSFYRDNVWTGLEVEMMMRFSLFLGRPVHFSGYEFGDIVDVLNKRQADVAAANMFITPERSDQVLFSHPYYLCKTSCFSKIL
jgi:ABC-type amino acid transport substrate-binding protein